MEPITSGNLTHDILDRLPHDSDHVALRRFIDSAWHDVTLGQFHADVVAVAKGLMASGISAGDRVAILAKTRYEWTVADYAIWWCSAISVPIYETSSPAQISWILSDSGARLILFESDAHESALATVRADCPALQETIRIDQIMTAVAERGHGISDEELETRRATVKSADIATLVYTSGTTGRPKGCQLTHGNFRAELAGALERLPELFADEDSSTLLFLPLAHVFARLIQIGALRHGAVLGHTADITNLVDHLGTFQPTFVLAVPRVFEKVFNGASAKAYADGKGKIFDRAAKIAIAYSKSLDAKGPSLLLRAQHGLYSALVFRKLRGALGGRASYAISGGAPLGDRLGHFFRGIGVTVVEGYGLTETSAALAANGVTRQKIGTVGFTFLDTEVRIAEDGELQFRGPQVFTGYWNNPVATADVLDNDGWFSTGDLGQIDDDGFIRITGRKKEIIVTAGGKNVSPAILEEPIRSHPWVSQCMVVGEGKPFIAALVTIDTEHYDGDFDAPELNDEIQKAVDEANSLVSRAESIRSFVILNSDWTEESGHLTPSFKVKRHAVMRDFHDVIEGIYVS